MNTSAAASARERALLLGSAVQDLELLARLHDREPDGDLLGELKAHPCLDWFNLRLDGDEAEAFAEQVDGYLLSLDDPVAVADLDTLCADYADLYLSYAARVSPTESVWLTEEHLERQEPMFAVRDWYRHHGLKVPDWRTRPDDHIVHQLQFVAHLLRHGEDAPLLDAGRFLDAHLLLWIDDFAEGMAKRAVTPFFAGLGPLTRLVVGRIRDVIESLSGEPRGQIKAEAAQEPAGSREESHKSYFPGAEPGW